MKKIYLAILGLSVSFGTVAQVFNTNLDSWTSGGSYDDPDGWLTANQYASFLSINPPVTKMTTGMSQGTAAAEMVTLDCFACAGLGAPDPLPGLMNQSASYGTLPTAITFDYQYTGASNDVGAVLVQLSVWDAVGDSAIVFAQAVDTLPDATSWTSMNIPFVYGASMTPDSIKIYFLSSANGIFNDPTLPDPQDGSVLKVDDIQIVDAATASISTVGTLEANVYVMDREINITTKDLLQGTVELIDLTGKVVSVSKLTGTTTRISGDHLTSGVYLVNVVGNNERIVKKIVIE